MHDPYNNSGYPTAYRPGAAKYGTGFQSPKPQWAMAPGWVERESSKLGWATPKNSWMPMWLKSPPSVPGSRSGPWSQLPPGPGSGPWGTAARAATGALRPAARALPVVGKVLDAIEIAQEVLPLLNDYFVSPDEFVPDQINPNGWTLCRTCGITGPTHWRSVDTANNGCPGCLTGQQFSVGGAFTNTLGAAGSGNTLILVKKVTNTPSYSYTHVYRRFTSTGSLQVPTGVAEHTVPGFVFPQPSPDRPPELDPNSQTKPGVMTSPFPAPVPHGLAPYVRANPDRAPSERGEYGPPRTPRPVVTRPRRPPKKERPPKKTKERKFVLNNFGGPLRKLLEQALEAKDLGDCLADAAGAPPGPLVSRMQWTYTNADKIDGCKFVECAINNQITDAAIGMLGKFAKAEARATGRSHGLSGLSKKLGGHDGEDPLAFLKISLGC